MKKLFRIILILLLVIITLIVGGYLYLRYMPEKSVAKVEAQFTLTAGELAKEYESNSTKSDKKFIDRVIEVTGTIVEISTDQNNSKVFILNENTDNAGILCTLTEKESKKADQYKVGDTVKIKGTCTGMLFEVILNKCVIVE